MSLSVLVPANEQALVRARATLLARDAQRGRWQTAHPPAAGLAQRVSTVVAAIAPRLPYVRLALLVRYALWTFLLDDEFDRSGAGLPQLNRLRDAVIAVTKDLPGPAHPLATELRGIRRRLYLLDRTGEAVSGFDAALQQAAAGEIKHLTLAQQVAAGRPPPQVDDYLAVAAHTVNYQSFAYALLAVQPAPRWPRAQQRGQAPPVGLARVAPALWHAACAVRLSNDLRSSSRDRAEGRLNVLGLPTGAGPVVTEAWARQAITVHLRDHEQALAHLPDELADAAATLRRSVEVSVGLYRHSDLR